MVKNQITARVTAEQEKFLNEVFPDANGKTIVDTLVEFYQNPPKADKPDVSEYTKKIAELNEKCKEFEDINNQNILKYHDDFEKYNENLQSLQSQNDTLKTEVEDLKQQLFAFEGRVPSANELVLTLPEPAKKLLAEYAKRLETTPADLLIYTFFRYSVERFTMSIFDFDVIKKKEFEEVCGLSFKELKELLKID